MTKNDFLKFLLKQNKINPAVLNSIAIEENSSNSMIDMIKWDGKKLDFFKEENNGLVGFCRVRDCFEHPEDLLKYEMVLRVLFDDSLETYSSHNIDKLGLYSLQELEIPLDYVIFSDFFVVLNARDDLEIHLLDEHEKTLLKKGLYFGKTITKVEELSINYYVSALINRGENK